MTALDPIHNQLKCERCKLNAGKATTGDSDHKKNLVYMIIVFKINRITCFFAMVVAFYLGEKTSLVSDSVFRMSQMTTDT